MPGVFLENAVRRTSVGSWQSGCHCLTAHPSGEGGKGGRGGITSREWMLVQKEKVQGCSSNVLNNLQAGANFNITSKHTHTHLAASKISISPRPAGLGATGPTFLCYLQRSPLTHLAAGLRCALSNNELCIRCCHFEKCNYLSDKADGPVLSGICCASIKSSVRWKTLSHTHKQGMWKLPCVNSHKQAKSLRSV